MLPLSKVAIHGIIEYPPQLAAKFVHSKIIEPFNIQMNRRSAQISLERPLDQFPVKLAAPLESLAFKIATGQGQDLLTLFPAEIKIVKAKQIMQQVNL